MRWLDNTGHHIPGHPELPVEKAAAIQILSNRCPWICCYIHTWFNRNFIVPTISHRWIKLCMSHQEWCGFWVDFWRSDTEGAEAPGTQKRQRHSQYEYAWSRTDRSRVGNSGVRKMSRESDREWSGIWTEKNQVETNCLGGLDGWGEHERRNLPWRHAPQ